MRELEWSVLWKKKMSFTLPGGMRALSMPHPTDDMVAWQISFFSVEPVTDQKSGTRRLWCLLGDPRK